LREGDIDTQLLAVFAGGKVVTVASRSLCSKVTSGSMFSVSRSEGHGVGDDGDARGETI